MKFKKSMKESLAQKLQHDHSLLSDLTEKIIELEKRIRHDENLSLKVIGEIGDLVRMMRQMEARIEKLERQNAKKKVREGKSGGQG